MIFGRDANRASGLQINKCSCDFSPVAEFQRPFSHAATSHDGDRVGGAAVNLDKRNQALAVLPASVRDSKFLKSKHRQTHAEHLPGAQVPVCLFSVAKITLE
jgi:hypothetical protein